MRDTQTESTTAVELGWSIAYPVAAGGLETMSGEGDGKQGISREGPLRSIASPPFAG